MGESELEQGRVLRAREGGINGKTEEKMQTTTTLIWNKGIVAKVGAEL
jgi:hypothetical protein